MKKLKTVCVIDDDKMYKLLLLRQLKAFNFCENILTFSNGLEALTYLNSVMASPDLLPDIILLDLNMPVMDGWQFLDEFVKTRPAKKIKMYVVSSSIDPTDHAKALAYEEVACFYSKPITKRIFEKILADDCE